MHLKLERYKVQSVKSDVMLTVHNIYDEKSQNVKIGVILLKVSSVHVKEIWMENDKVRDWHQF
jgi:hypothetical protein